MRQLSVFLGFVPWIAFTVLCGPSTWQWAAGTALVITLALSVPDWRRRREISVLDGGGIVLFAVLAVLPAFLAAGTMQALEDRAQLISGVAITLIALASLALGRPFTEFYARQSTPREYWGSPLFARINRVLTAFWAGVFALNALFDVLAMAFPAGADLLNWVVPTLLIVAAVKFTMWYPDHASEPADTDRSAPGIPAQGGGTPPRTSA